MTKFLKCGKTFLLWYAHDHIYFRLQELQAITKLFNIEFDWLEEPSINDPYLLINVSSPSVIMKIMSRTVLVRSAYELWTKNTTLAGLHSSLKEMPEKFIEPYCKKDVSFRILVETFGKKMSQEYKVQKIEELDFLPFEGAVKLKEPDYSFLFMEYYGTDRRHAPHLPFQYFFGRWVADGQRFLCQKINLSARKFIGNTTMDPLLSLVMANMACVKSGDLVLDPFVGTGGLLVSAAHCGGYVLGTDIDYLMLHAGHSMPNQHKKRKI